MSNFTDTTSGDAARAGIPVIRGHGTGTRGGNNGHAAIVSEFGRVNGGEAMRARTARIDLGLALLSLAALPGTPLDQADIAAWCGCSRSNIWEIEQRALRKLRNRLRFMNDPRLVDAMSGLFERREPARKTTRKGWEG